MPRERFLAYGSDRLSTPELLALILGTGTRGQSAVAVSERIIGSMGGIAQLARATPRELATLHGIGAARAARIAASFEISRRAMEANLDFHSQVHSAADVYARLRNRMDNLMQEIFVVLALDARHTITDEIEIARGCLTHVEVHPREVFRPLIRQAAAAAVVAHNHPSGDCTPSPDDIALTGRLRQVGEIVGIPILDHLVVGKNGYTSIAECIG